MDDRSKIEAAAEAMWQEESHRCLGRARLIAWDEEGDDIRQKWIGLARVAASALTTPEPKAGTERVRHVKRGTEYEVLGEAALQIATENGEPRDSRRMNDYSPVVVYRSLDTGCLWVRPYDEFQDGRFVPVSLKEEDTPRSALNQEASHGKS